jgi:adenosine deaminase
VVGLDLAGAPSSGHSFGLADYADPFERARAMGLGRTVHAGEGRSVDEIRIAVEQLHAQRIGHGTTLLDDPAVLDLVRDRDVTIEACLTSNVHTGAIDALADHPLPRWLDCGVRCCINTDNTLFSDISSSEEHAHAAQIPGMTAEHLARAEANGHRAAFHSG